MTVTTSTAGNAVLCTDAVVRGTPDRTGWPRALPLLILATFVLAYPLSVHPETHVMGGGADTRLFIWTLAWNAHALVTNPLSVFDANIYYPLRLTLAYSENLLGSTPIAAPVLWLTGDHVLMLNAVQLTSVVLCGLGAFVLARRLGPGFAGAMLCGLVFAFSPPRFFRIGQVHLTTVQWIPFALAALHAYLDEGKPRHLRIAVALGALQALTSGHGFVFLLLAGSLVVVYRVALGEPLLLRRRLRDCGAFGVGAVALVVLLFAPYLIVQEETGLRRSLVNWAPTPQSFIASPSRVDSALVSWLAGAEAQEGATAFLFPGFLPLLLGAVGLIPLRRIRHGTLETSPQPTPRSAFARWAETRRRDPVLLYGLITIVAFLLSVGPPLGLWPLVYWMPGLNFVRVPSRFTILAVLGLAVLAGVGFERLAARLPSRWRRRAAVILGVLLAVEFAAVPLPVRPFAVEIPDVDRWLDTRPKPFVVAEFPARRSERLIATYMLHSMGHWQKTVHGYSGHRDDLHRQLYRELRGFPDEATLARLVDLGVNYVVVHSELYTPDQWMAVEPRIRAADRWLTLLYSSGPGRVYALTDGRRLAPELPHAPAPAESSER